MYQHFSKNCDRTYLDASAGFLESGMKKYIGLALVEHENIWNVRNITGVIRWDERLLFTVIMYYCQINRCQCVSWRHIWIVFTIYVALRSQQRCRNHDSPTKSLHFRSPWLSKLCENLSGRAPPLGNNFLSLSPAIWTSQKLVVDRSNKSAKIIWNSP